MSRHVTCPDIHRHWLQPRCQFLWSDIYRMHDLLPCNRRNRPITFWMSELPRLLHKPTNQLSRSIRKRKPIRKLKREPIHFRPAIHPKPRQPAHHPSIQIHTTPTRLSKHPANNSSSYHHTHISTYVKINHKHDHKACANERVNEA